MSSDPKSCQELDAIALGVKIKFDPLSAFSKIITQRTVEIARQIGIPESAVQRWKAKKRKQGEKAMELINRSKLTTA